MKRWILLFCLLTLTAGCASIPDWELEFDELRADAKAARESGEISQQQYLLKMARIEGEYALKVEEDERRQARARQAVARQYEQKQSEFGKGYVDRSTPFLANDY